MNEPNADDRFQGEAAHSDALEAAHEELKNADAFVLHAANSEGELITVRSITDEKDIREVVFFAHAFLGLHIHELASFTQQRVPQTVRSALEAFDHFTTGGDASDVEADE